MPVLALQPPGDTLCTLRLGALAAAAAALAARRERRSQRFLTAFLPPAGRSEEAAAAAHRCLSRRRFLSAFLADRLTPSLFRGRVTSSLGLEKKIFFFEDRGGWQRQGLLLLASRLPLLPLQDRKAKPTTAPASSFPSSTSLSTSASFALSSPNYLLIMLPSLGGLVPLTALGSPGLPWMHFLKMREPGSEFPPRRV